MIGIIDYGLGNVSAFHRLFYRENIESKIVSNKKDFKDVKKIIFPGVGAFDDTINKLNNSGLRDTLDHLVLEDKIPIFGVCIGMHIFGNSSEEGSLKGLGYINGDVVHIQNIIDSENLNFPHMGWNSIKTNFEHKIFSDVDKGFGFYFLHSYVFVPSSIDSILCTSNYHKDIVSGIKHQNVYGFQFHPEKSHHNGIKLLKNFSNLDA